MKKTISSLLSTVLILSSILIVFTLHPGKAEAAVFSISSNRLLQDEDNPNLYYFVGMVYYEVWKNNSGQWTGGGHKPGDTVAVVDGGTYEFTFGSSRKIKDIRIKPFDFNWELADETFETSRTGELAVNRKQYYQDATSTRSYNNYRNTPVAGKGTNVGQKEVFVLNGTLEAVKQVDRRLEEETENGQVFGENVEGWRYFFPTLFTIELEPEEGKAVVQHWTTTGKRLNNVDGFKDREEKLEKNKDYRFTHTPGTENYTYVGHKKSTVAPPSGGEITPGDPSGFKYDASFPVYYVYYYYKEEGDPPPPTTPPPTDASCTEPVPGQTLTGKYMDPVVTAKIWADQRHNEQFDVLKGIPTSESLYGNVFSRNYLFENTFVQMTGTCTYKVNVEKTYTLNWDPGKTVTDDEGNETTEPDPQTKPEKKVYPYTIERPYAFWTIDTLHVLEIDQAKLENYAFSSGAISFGPSGYTAPDFNTEESGNFYPAPDPGTITAPGQTIQGGKTPPSVPNEDLKSLAEEKIPPVEVENDYLVFNGQIVMSKERASEEGPQPGEIPAPTQISEDVLYSPGHVIPSSKTNRKDATSKGEIDYTLMSGSINGGSDQKYPIYGINTVTVHTPVVNYSSVSDDQAHNQKTNPNMSRAAFILNRPFTVQIPTSGQHLNESEYPGYGNRDYAKYFRTKQVRFPFDVYTKNQEQFIPANTWTDIPVGDLHTEFFLPIWVDEGDYQVYFRSIAENAPSGFSWQADANADLAHHVATDQVSVEVIGRLFDFHITDIADFNWEHVFRIGSNSSQPTGISYWTGQGGIDGEPRGNDEIFTLPIRPGSNPLSGKKNVSVKTGYSFRFDLKTMGNMFNVQDGIRITPTFSYVGKGGGVPIPVDLYYQTNEQPFVKIGSAEDKVSRYVVLNDRMRNIPLEPLTDAATFKYYNHLSAEERAEMTINDFLEYYVLDYTKEKTPVGGYDLLLLPEQLKTLIGPKRIPSTASVTTQRANASVQKWYGEYSIPAAAYVVPAGTNLAEYGRLNGGLDDDSEIFLKDGYIVVNFDIESIRNGNLNEPHLQYIHAPLMNQWQLEGYRNNVFDSYNSHYSLRDGDIVFYNADKSSRNDFSSQVPH